ncbi:MAG: STAS domain-containing protein [Planctomycetota bacterium]
MGEVPLSNFEESEGRLKVTGELDRSSLEPFGEHLKAYVGKASGDFEIDMIDIRYVTSSFIGYLARSLIDAKAKGCSVKILVNDRVAKLLKVAGIDKLAPIVVGKSDA